MFAWLVWIQPIALAGLLAVAGPIAVHLLRRQRAPRVPFACLRFVRAATTAAVRLRLPSDFWLLTLRVMIVCAAAAALAQPLFVTPARRSGWNARISRAIVVDISASVAKGARQREEAAAAEARGAVYATRIDVDRLGTGLVRAVGALAAAPPSRREIVVISDLPQNSLTSADVARVPGDVGLRFVAVDAPPMTDMFRGDTVLGASGIQSRVQEIHATLDGTAVRFRPVATPATGLRFLNAGAAGDALLRAVARAGAPAPSAQQPLAVIFGPNPPNPTSRVPPATHEWGQTGVRPVSDPGLTPQLVLPRWMLRTIVAMRRDTSLDDAAREHRRQGSSPGPPWIVVARDAGDVPVVAAAAAEHELLVHVAGGPGDYLAAAALRSALTARRGAPEWGEYELARIPASKLSRWTRTPGNVNPTAWKNAAPGDARWMWIFVLALLGVEGLARRRRRDRTLETYADAA
jgi:aerotolerance regulator-like protein